MLTVLQRYSDSDRKLKQNLILKSSNFRRINSIFPIFLHVCQPPKIKTPCARLMVVKARHGERPGEGFNSNSQVCNASYRLWILKEEVLEILKLSCNKKKTSQWNFHARWFQAVLSKTVFKADSPVFFLTSKAILKPSSRKSTTCTKSSSLNCREVRAGAPKTQKIQHSGWVCSHHKDKKRFFLGKNNSKNVMNLDRI